MNDFIEKDWRLSADRSSDGFRSEIRQGLNHIIDMQYLDWEHPYSNWGWMSGI